MALFEFFFSAGKRPKGGHKSISGSAGIGMYLMRLAATADFIRRGFAARTNSRALDGLLVRF